MVHDHPRHYTENIAKISQNIVKIHQKSSEPPGLLYGEPNLKKYYGDPGRGFREPGEWGPKQPGSQEQVAKMTREQGEEESNLGIPK